MVATALANEFYDEIPLILFRFALQIVSFTQIITVIMYIFTMLYVLFTYYWQANELLTEVSKHFFIHFVKL